MVYRGCRNLLLAWKPHLVVAQGEVLPCSGSSSRSSNCTAGQCVNCHIQPTCPDHAHRHRRGALLFYDDSTTHVISMSTTHVFLMSTTHVFPVHVFCVRNRFSPQRTDPTWSVTREKLCYISQPERPTSKPFHIDLYTVISLLVCVDAVHRYH